MPILQLIQTTSHSARNVFFVIIVFLKLNWQPASVFMGDSTNPNKPSIEVIETSYEPSSSGGRNRRRARVEHPHKGNQSFLEGEGACS